MSCLLTMSLVQDLPGVIDKHWFQLSQDWNFFLLFHSTLMRHYVTWMVASKIANAQCEATPSVP